MSTKQPPSDLPISPFKSADAFDSFLEHEHSTSPGIWLKLAKKSSGIPSVTYDEALEVALCFGWIDGQRKPFDDKWYLSRFVPRKSRSLWFKRNVDLVRDLSESGRMRSPGLAAVEAAKADGRWERAYAGSATMEVPEDFSTALHGNAAAKSVFEGLNRGQRYSVLWRVQTASPENRAKRIGLLVKDLADGNVPGNSKRTVKPKRKAPVEPASSKSLSEVGSEDLGPAKPSPPPGKVTKPRQPRRTGLRPRG